MLPRRAPRSRGDAVPGAAEGAAAVEEGSEEQQQKRGHLGSEPGPGNHRVLTSNSGEKLAGGGAVQTRDPSTGLTQEREKGQKRPEHGDTLHGNPLHRDSSQTGAPLLSARMGAADQLSHCAQGSRSRSPRHPGTNLQHLLSLRAATRGSTRCQENSPCVKAVKTYF